MTVFMEAIPAMVKESGKVLAMIQSSIHCRYSFLLFEKLRKNPYILKISQLILCSIWRRGILELDFAQLLFGVFLKLKNKDAKGTYFRLHERKLSNTSIEDIEKLLLYKQCENLTNKVRFGSISGRGWNNWRFLEKARIWVKKSSIPTDPSNQLQKIPGSPIAYCGDVKHISWYDRKRKPFISDYAFQRSGMSTTDNIRFLRFAWNIWPERLLKCNLIRVKADEVIRNGFLIIKAGEVAWIMRYRTMLELENNGNEIKMGW